MSNTKAVTAVKHGEPSYLPWLTIFVFWALVLALVLSAGASPLLDGKLVGTDGYMRLVRVELLHETGAWFDGRIPRSNAPYGDTLHWTRPFDVMVLGAAWLLAPFLGFETALFWGGSILSPILLLVSALVMMWASWPVIYAQLRPYVAVAFFLQMAVLSYSMPGRVDHHTLQFLLLIVSMGMVIRLCTGRHTERPKRAQAVLAGGVLGLGIWVSVEFLLVTLLSMTALWLSWLRYGAGRGSLAAGLAVGLAGSVALALLIERPIGAMMVEERDRISIVHLTIMLAHLSFWVLVLVGEKLAGTAFSPRGRLAFSLVGAVAGGALIYFIYPEFFAYSKSFGGTTADGGGEDLSNYYSKIKELQPLMPTDANALGRLLFWVGPAVICLPFVLRLVWVKRRENDWIVWMYFAIALGLYVALSLRYVRFAPFAEIMAVVPLVYLIGDLRQRLNWIASQAWRDAARSLVSLTLIIGVSGAWFAFGYRPFSASRAGASVGAGPTSTEGRESLGIGTWACDIRAIAAFLNRPRPFGSRPRIIATHVDFGPELLYRTKHSVVGTPYHRAEQSIRDVYRIFSASNNAQSKRLLDARGVELVLICPSPRGTRTLYELNSERGTFYSRLRNAQVPTWMRPVSLPADTGGFRLYEVIR